MATPWTDREPHDMFPWKEVAAMKQAPERWKVVQTRSELRIMPDPLDKNGGPIAVVNEFRGSAPVNARRIAACPEMYDLLRELADGWDAADNAILQSYREDARALLARIDGAA